MRSISRRGFVVSAAAAGTAFGLDGALELVRPALAQGKDFAAQGFAKFKVGDLAVTTVYDGVWERAIDANLAKNVPFDEVKAASKAAGYPDAFTPIAFTVTVVQKGDQTIMFDSGTGGGQTGGPKAGLLAKQNLAAAGIDASKINTIIVTHYHSDHIFGMMEKETNKLLFPNAEIVVPASEHKYWTDPELIGKLPEARRPLAQRIQATLPAWKNVKQVADGTEVIPGVRSINTNGHTPGHTSYEFVSGNQKLIVSGDVSNVQPLFLKNPDWHFVGDQDPELAVRNRKALFDRVVAEGAVVTGYHWGMPGAGTIKKDGNGYALVPVDAA